MSTPTQERPSFLADDSGSSAGQQVAAATQTHGGKHHTAAGAAATSNLPGGEQQTVEPRRNTNTRGRGRGRGGYQNGSSHASHLSTPHNFAPATYDPNRSYHNPSYPQLRNVQQRNMMMPYAGYESFVFNVQHMNGLPPMVMDPMMARQLILQQCEYYFSVENLCKDMYLRRHMDDQGFVNLPVLANFNRVRSITLDYALIRDVCIASQHIELRSSPGQYDKIRAAHGWAQWVLPVEQRDPSTAAQPVQVPEIPIQAPAPAVAVGEDDIQAFQSRQQAAAKGVEIRSGEHSPMDTSASATKTAAAAADSLASSSQAGGDSAKLSNLVGAPVFVPGQQARPAGEDDVGTSVLTENFAQVGLGKLSPEVKDFKPADPAGTD